MVEKKTKEYWSMTEGVFNCLIDKKRTLAFGKAIRNTIKDGDIVVDMGTGSGILAMLAVDAGAKKVYAVEFDKKNIKTLENTFKINNYSNKIVIIEGDVTKIKLPEKVDVIMGEMIATGLIEELQIPAMNNVLKYANKNVKVLLNKFENYIDLVYNNEKFYGKNFKIVRYEYPDENDLRSKNLSKKILLNRIDFSVINKKNKIKKNIVIKIEKKGFINGIRISSETIFFDETCFDYSFAYSYPIILPIEEYKVKKGDVFLVNIEYVMCGGFKTLKYLINKK
ncbi:MAG: 50S ribosomal protein L11 methyltransferase [bacterium]|nr:50S ribosomal protein L11 methyltransferase [bacterium]